MTTAVPHTTNQTVNALDGYPIHATFYTPTDMEIRGGVMIASAMGVPQEFYDSFAHWLGELGFVVATLDYRGMGKSLHGSIRDVDTDVVKWAELDAAAVLHELERKVGDRPVYWVGHSLGAQLFPFVEDRSRVKKIFTIASGNGWWKENSPELKRRISLLWFVAVPLTIPVFGYFPGKKLNMVGDVPKGVMQQWRRWCLNPKYCMIEGDKAVNAYNSVKIPLVGLYMKDDEMMSEKNILSLHNFYRNAPKKMTRLDPVKHNLKRLGHFGFFKKDMKPLWEKYLLNELLN